MDPEGKAEFRTVQGVASPISLVETFATAAGQDSLVSGGTWNNGARPGLIDTLTASLNAMLNRQHEPVMSWRLRGCVPVRLSYSDLTADSADPMVEEIELALEAAEVQFI